MVIRFIQFWSREYNYLEIIYTSFSLGARKTGRTLICNIILRVIALLACLAIGRRHISSQEIFPTDWTLRNIKIICRIMGTVLRMSRFQIKFLVTGSIVGYSFIKFKFHVYIRCREVGWWGTSYCGDLMLFLFRGSYFT